MKKGAAVAATNASRWRYQGTDVNGDGVYLSYACWFLRLVFDKRIESRKNMFLEKENKNAIKDIKLSMNEA